MMRCTKCGLKIEHIKGSYHKTAKGFHHADCTLYRDMDAVMKCSDKKCQCWKVKSPPHDPSTRYCAKCKHWCHPSNEICKTYCPEHLVA